MSEDLNKLQISEKYHAKVENIDYLEEDSVEAPRYGCALSGVYATVLGLNRSVPILHSGAGCGVGHLFGTLYAGGEACGQNAGGTATPCTCLVEEHVILGGEEKIDNLIKSTTELFNADFYTVISGCVPSLIGDDVDQVVEDNQGLAPLIHVNAPGFKAHSWEGHNLFWDSLIESDILEEQEVDEKLVNIFGIVPYFNIFWNGDLHEIKEHLEAIGLKVNTIFAEGNGLENLKNIPKAAYNIVLSPWIGVRAVEQLEEKFGTPFIKFDHVPIGAKQTSHFLTEVGKALNVDPLVVSEYIKNKEQWYYRLAELPGDAMILCRPNQYFAVAADSTYAIAYTKYLVNELGYLPDIVQITDNPPLEVREHIVEALSSDLESSFGPEIVFEADTYKIRKNLDNRPFAFLLSSSLDRPKALEEWGACHVIAAFPDLGSSILVNHFTGYTGGLTLLEDLVSTFVGPL